MRSNIKWALHPTKQGGWNYTIETPAGLVVGYLRPMSHQAARKYVEKQIKRYEERWLTIR